MMRQAIITRFIGPTNFRPARIKVTCDAKTITVAWNYEFSMAENHRHAAKALIRALGWHGQWAQGGMPLKSQDSCCFVPFTFFRENGRKSSTGSAFIVRP